MTRTLFHGGADCDPPRRIDFHRIRGDLKQEEGTWLLTATADGSATVVEYEMYLDPGFWIPQWLVTRTLRKAGWRVVRIWECRLARKHEGRVLRRLKAALASR